MAEDFAGLWRQFARVWETGNTEGMDDLLSTDVVYHIPPFPDITGLQGVKEFITAFRPGFPDIRVDTKDDIASGNTSVHRWYVEATFSGETPLLAVAPTGNRTTAHGDHILHWSNGKITEAWHFGDWLSWLTQAGAIPPLPAQR